MYVDYFLQHIYVNKINSIYTCFEQVYILFIKSILFSSFNHFAAIILWGIFFPPNIKLFLELYISLLGGYFMEINELINLITNNGFPVVVSAYLLIRLEKQIISFSSSINKLNTIISTKLGIVIDTNTQVETVLK